MRAFILSIAVLALAACATGTNAGNGPDGLQSFTVDQGPCFGACPVYEITVRPGDQYELDGRRFTRTDGLSSGQLRAGAFADIASAVAAIDFRNLPGDMTFTNPQACSGPQVSDMPYFELTARYADGDKTVRWYQGCNYPGMHDFVDRLQDFYEMDRLIIPARG
tara:strand:+ start:3979 stop:4470 length:492 start_codon:yes stop_codon:yes gene_type:complete